MTTTKPFRQIRATCQPAATADDDHGNNASRDDSDDLITVYQAYNAAIADAACTAQRLDASPLFKPTRMTWIKPSWCWMMYRAGYSYKDDNQARILALRMRRRDFWALLRMAELTTHVQHGAAGAVHQTEQQDTREEVKGAKTTEAREGGTEDRPKSNKVKVQWDPERDARLEKLSYRSIQIGIPAAVAGQWIKNWIVDITDVTDTARALKRALDDEPGVSGKELVARGLCPVEEVVVVPQDLRVLLQMDM